MSEANNTIHKSNQRLGREVILQAMRDYKETCNKKTTKEQTLFYNAERFLFPQSRLQEKTTRFILELADIRITDFKKRNKKLIAKYNKKPPKGARILWID